MKTKTVTTKLISAFVFATRILQSLYFLNPKFLASVGPGRKPESWFSHDATQLSFICKKKNCNVTEDSHWAGWWELRGSLLHPIDCFSYGIARLTFMQIHMYIYSTWGGGFFCYIPRFSRETTVPYTHR